MFDMRTIGRRISDLRKANNMTQMELADRLNISFQAVSNWERGNSMPDISKLPELADMFDTTIDELLGASSVLLDSVVHDQLQEYLDGNEVTSEELSEVAAVLKPDQVDSIFLRVGHENLKEMTGLLPFLRSDMIDKLAKAAAAQRDYDALSTMAPFVSEGVIDEIAKAMLDSGADICILLPFMSSDVIGDLAKTQYEKGGCSDLDVLLPFLSQDTLRQIAEEELQAGGLRNIQYIAPFLDSSYLNELVKKAMIGARHAQSQQQD